MRPALLGLLAILCLIPATLSSATLAKSPDSNWGAIAYSYSTGRYGSSYNYPTQARAINSAVERCNAPDCRAVVWFENSCGSFARGNGTAGWGIGRSAGEAEEKALAECRKHGGGCRIVAWACTSR